MELVCLNRLYVKGFYFFYLLKGMKTVSDWECFPYPVVKQIACKSAAQATLIGHAECAAERQPKPTQCKIEAGML